MSSISMSTSVTIEATFAFIGGHPRRVLIEMRQYSTSALLLLLLARLVIVTVDPTCLCLRSSSD